MTSSTTRRRRSLAVVVLAAGKGNRMRSARPKVLHELCGRPSIWHVIQAGLGARPDRLVVVVGQGRERVEDAVRSFGLRLEPTFVDQGEPLGTGHAVAVTEAATEGVDDVVVMAGDGPLVTGAHVRDLLRAHRRGRAAGGLLTTLLDNPRGYGRVVREDGRLVRIAEESDAGPEVLAIREVSTLVYTFRRDDLFKALPLVGRENRQREYYLQDVFPILQDKGERVVVARGDFGGSLGVNSRLELARAARILRDRLVEEHMGRGVTFVDPETVYLDVDVRIGADTVIHPLTFLEAGTRVGSGCSIGPASQIARSTIGDGAEVAFSVVRGARVARGARVGPYASVRDATVIGEGGKVGTFVETKATRIGKGSKVPHLSYVGDAVIGRGANLGAGTITCNFDGYEKHRTVVGDEAFVGSDTMLIAPVRIGKGAWTAAGSAIAKDVPDGALAIERSEPRVVRGYDDRKRAAHGGRAPGSGRHGGGKEAAERTTRGGRGGA